MDMFIRIKGVICLCFLINVALILGERVSDCPPRRTNLQRTCRKTCVEDIDCRSKKKSCQCDGDCGLSCIKDNQQCDPVKSVKHGKVEIQPTNKFGAIAVYSCQPGYKLRGNSARVCQGDRHWSGSEPHCQRTGLILKEKDYCGAPPNIDNAYHDGPPDKTLYWNGEMVQYKCKAEFSMNDGAVRAWCVGDELWVGPNITCTHAGCDKLQDIENGEVRQEPTSHVGSRATYECEPGFYLAGRAERVCGPHGDWEGVQPSCEKVTCGSPPDLQYGNHDGSRYEKIFPSGKQVTYKCDKGYYGDGYPMAMCSENGEWKGLTLSCSPIICGHPGDILHGERKGFLFTFRSKVSYHCIDGFELIGDAYRTCQDDGTWNGSVPECTPIQCKELLAPVFGRMNGSGTEYGTVVTFECDEGYTVVGSKERMCQSDKTWSGQTAKCEEINCGWPEPFYNGYLIGHKTTVDSMIFFSCRTRTTFDGPSFDTRCLPNGTWSNPTPKCWGQCQVPPIKDAELIGGGRESMFANHNTLIEFKCKNGLVPREGSSMRCNNGTWTSVAECIPAPCISTPPHVLNGMRVFTGLMHGNQAKYKCFPGYKLTGTESSYLLCEYGSWTGGRPHCEEFYCPSPKDPLHGKVYKRTSDGDFRYREYMKSIKHGDRLVYKCEDGYRLRGPEGATCVDGNWQPPLDSTCVVAKHPPFRKLWTPMSNLFT